MLGSKKSMSVKAMSVAWESNLKPGAKLVLLAIADHADGQGICWPGQDYIAEKCNMNRSTVNQHIGDLVDSGYLFMEKGRSKTGQAIKSVYRVNMEKPTLENTTLEKEKKVQKSKKPTLEKPTLEKHVTNVGKDNIPSLYEPSMNPHSFCADPSGPLQASIKIPLNASGTFHDVFENDIKKYSELYPAVDVMQELRGMVGWCDANPTKRKTKDGVKRFINSWLAKKQDQGGSRPATMVPQQIKPAPQYIPPEQRKAAFSGNVYDSTAEKL